MDKKDLRSLTLEQLQIELENICLLYTSDAADEL